ncbi:hypothetical protein PRIC1_010049 [Phytophthora ramorum]
MSTTFKRFAIVGGGNIGGIVARELLKKNLAVTILTRDDTKASLQEFKKNGATLAKVDYENRESLKNALMGVEAVVSAVGPMSMSTQIEVVYAAKEAGVELFAPSESLLKKVDLPYTIFYAGIFYEFAPIAFGHKYSEGKMDVVGDGKTQFSLTAANDVGELVAQVVSTVSKRDLKWAKEMELTFVDYEKNKANYLTDFASFLSTLATDGLAVTGTNQEVAAARAKFYPNWKPTPYDAFIANK